MITFIIVVYKSDKYKLSKFLKIIGNKYKLIIIDNSYDYDFSGIKISKKTKIIRSKNIGNGSGINIGIKKCKTKFAIYSDIDVKFKKNFVTNFINYAKNFKNFSILIPNHGKTKISKIPVNDYIGEASVMLYNVNKVKNLGLFDENYFLYFEETDLLLRSKRRNLNSCLIPALKIKHQRASSVKKNIDTNCLRAWHYMWSMFYFYRKNYTYMVAFRKISKFIFKDSIMLLYYLCLMDKNNFKLRFYRLYGAISSMIGLKSFLRL